MFGWLVRSWRTNRSIWLFGALTSGLSCYLILAFSFAHTKMPWVDEGWIASAPANWAKTGGFGTPSLQPAGSWLNGELTGIRKYTYWNLPVAIAVQAACYKIIGFSVLKMRAIGIFAGLLALLSWFAIVSKLSGSVMAAYLTVVLLCFDYTFLWGAADGRMDMMCGAWGAAGLAVYLMWREARFERSLWVASTLLALSLFTHPNGSLFLGAFLFLLWLQDRDRLNWRSLSALTPYFAIAALWAIYALRRPDYFLAQIAANSMAVGGARWAGLLHPIPAIVNEVLIRYLAHYGAYPLWAGEVPNYALLIPVSYWILLIASAAYWRQYRPKGFGALLILTGFVIVCMTFFVGLKAQCYLVLLLPFYAATGAVLFCRSHVSRSAFAPLSLFLLAVVTICNMGVISSKLRQNPFASTYQPAVQFVRARLRPGDRVTADSYFGFDLGFDRVNDDCRLGYYSNVRTELIIADLWYRTWWQTLFPGQEPEVGDYVQQLLTTDYRIVFRNGPFLVYERRGT
jgi:4-amino-4-deoxy-L-arabinose transferase-like glycosyltransferase